MPYDELGAYYPGDEPTVDQMQYELAKKGQTARPLDKAINSFKQLSSQMNPMLAPLYLRDAGKMLTNMASPIVGAYAGVLGNVQAKGAEQLYRLAGDEASAQEAANRVVRPDSPEQAARFYSPMQTPAGQAVETGVGKAFEALKLPPLGPGSGMPGTAPVSPRPFITPNDVRVMGAEAARVGRQVRDIPTDFQNAQSGFQRIDPITGQPVLGAKIQSGVDRIGDIMEQRKMQGLTPVPGLPAALQPETSMYAVRPSGTRISTPVIPETAKGFNPPYDPVNDMLRAAGVEPGQAETSPTLLHSLNRSIAFAGAPSERAALTGYRDFVASKVQEMYPEATTPQEAMNIFNAMYYDDTSRHAKENELFNEFIQSTEGRQLVPSAVPTGELAARHDAAVEGLTNMWGKYLVKNLGTEGNPLVKMAAEKGLTFLPEETIRERARDEGYSATFNRNSGFMPVQGSFAEPIANLQQEINAIALPLQNAANAVQTIGRAASDAGQDPATVPEFLEARSKAEKLNKQKNELQKKLDNLTLASAYEAVEDAAVKPKPAASALNDMMPSERRFYPSLKEAADRGELGYVAGTDAIEQTGLFDAARQFYEDVLKNKIPKEKASTYPVDKYIRENAEARVKLEKAEKAKLDQHKNAVIQDLKTSADAIPEDKRFGNVGVIELTQDTPKIDAYKEAAASTEKLDICIGEGGSGTNTKNLFTGKKNPRYTPVVNLLTGEPNPNATRNTTSWVEGIYAGEQLPMMRDLETGLPIAAFHFRKSSAIGKNGQPQFYIGFASGESNGRIEAKYIDGIRDYLNSRADDISSIGEYLEDNTGIHDTTDGSSLRKAQSQAQVSLDQMKAVDWDTMPRFMTAKDIKEAVQAPVQAPVQASAPATVAGLPAEVQRSLQTQNQRITRAYEGALTQDTGFDDADTYIGEFSDLLGTMANTMYANGLSNVDILERLADRVRVEHNQLSNPDRVIGQGLTTYQGQAIRDRLNSAYGSLNTLREEMNAPQTEQQRAVEDALTNPDIDNLRAIEFAMQGDRPNAFWGEMPEAARQQALQRVQEEIQNLEAAQLWEPDETHPANQPTRITNAQGSVFDTTAASQEFRIPPDLADNIARLIAGRGDDALETRHYAGMIENALNRTQGTIFANLTHAEALGALRMIEAAQQEYNVNGRADSQALFFRPENQPAPVAGMPAPRDVYELIQSTLDNIRTEVSAATAERVETVAYRVAEGQYSPRRFPVEYANALRRAADTEDSMEVELNLYDLADQVETNMRTAEQPDLTQIPLEELRRQLLDTNDGGVFRRMNARTDELAQRAREYNIPIEAAQRSIREGTVDMEGFSPYEREYIAREVGTLLEMSQRSQERRAQLEQAPTQPNVAPFNRLPENLQRSRLDELTGRMPEADRNDVVQLANQLTDVNSPEEIANIVGLVRSHLMGGWENFSDNQREVLARELEQYVDERTQEQVGDIMANVSMSMHESVDIYGLESAVNMVNEIIANVRRGEVGDLLFDTEHTALLPGARDQLIDELQGLRSELESDYGDDEGPTQRRGPFQPGGSSAVRGLPLGNLNIRPSITADVLRGPDRQPVSNFLQQVKSMPGVTQEGLKTGLMAFKNMDPSRQITKAEFARELLPSSYDIVSLKGLAEDNVHYREQAEDYVEEYPESVYDAMGISEKYHDELAKVIRNDTAFGGLSKGAKKELKKQNINNYDDLSLAYDKSLKVAIENAMQYMADMNGEQLQSENGYTYEDVQRLTMPSMGDEYGEFGVVHPDQGGTYRHYGNAPKGTIGHFRGTYNHADPLELRTVTNETFTTKPGSYVIEEIQSDAQKGSAQKAHLHQVHGVLFKAAIQKALELGADTVYLPTAKVIASERPSVVGWEDRPDPRGFTMRVPIRKDATSKFAPIYDQAIVKEGLKPLLKIPGVTSRIVNGYHEIDFTPEAKEHILNGPGQSIPGYKKGGTVQPIPSVEQMKRELMMRRA
jgi:hypothetical protein